VWWFYLFWLPKFLDASFGVKLAGLSTPLVVIYVVADIGSVFGGYLSGAIIKRGSTVNRGRKTAMLIAALLIVPTMFAPRVSKMWVAVALVSLAAAAHQWWSANLFTTAGDMFPRRAVASVVGFGGFAGAIGGVLFQRLVVGRLLGWDPAAYRYIFIFCGSIYIIALGLIHLIVPRMEPAQLEGDSP
jgi:ACS family hexuronate transporter-like MFS transporter